MNGVDGIGTGYSSFLPCYNPKDIIKNLTNLINNEPMTPMDPYYKGFKGEIVKVNDTGYQTRGVFKKVNNTKIEVQELPVGRWTDDYKEFLESEVMEKIIKDSENHSTEDQVRFIVEFRSKETLDALINSGDIYKELRLTKQFSVGNMMLFDNKGKIKKYHDPLDIIKDFYNVRLEYYNKRKMYLLALYKRQYDIAEARVRFIMAIIDKRLIVFQKSKQEIETQLITMIFPKMDLQGGSNLSYKYLMDMAIHNFSQEKIDELLNHQKEKKIKLETLEGMELEDIWIDDLNDFIKVGLL